MKDRFRDMRKTLGFTQQQLAERLGIKRNTVAQYEIGRNPPPEPILALLESEYKINLVWLRTGEGDMFARHAKADDISAFMGDILAGPDDFKARFIVALSKLTRDEWILLEKVATNLIDSLNRETPAK